MKEGIAGCWTLSSFANLFKLYPELSICRNHVTKQSLYHDQQTLPARQELNQMQEHGSFQAKRTSEQQGHSMPQLEADVGPFFLLSSCRASGTEQQLASERFHGSTAGWHS